MYKFLDCLAVFNEKKPIRVLVAGRSPLELRNSVIQRYGFVTVIGNFKSLSVISNLSRVGVCIDDVGGGFKLKILDYLYMGMPIVGLTSALEGIPSTLGVSKFNNYEDLIEFIYIILAMNDELNDMSYSNALLLTEYFSKTRFTKKLNELLVF